MNRKRKQKQRKRQKEKRLLRERLLDSQKGK